MKLYGINYSPWTERARLALVWNRVPFQYSEHTLLLGMPHLWWATRVPLNQLTVPALVVPNQKAVIGSLRIAQLANEHRSRKESLFDNVDLDSLIQLESQIEIICDASRRLKIAAILRSPDAQEAALPSFIPRWIRPLLRFMSKVGSRYVAHEFNIPVQDSTWKEAQALIYSGLKSLQKMSDWSPRPLKGSQVSYTDILVATTLEAIAPPPPIDLQLSPVLRNEWRHPHWETEFNAMLQWREWLYANYFR